MPKSPSKPSQPGAEKDSGPDSPEQSARPLSFHPLHDSPLVRIHDYQCRACRGGPTAEERSASNDIVLMRHGAFSRHFGRRSVTADVNQAAFFSQGSLYRVSHPGDCGDRGTVFSPSRRALNHIIRQFDPSIDDHPDQPFPFAIGPCHPGVFQRHRQFVQRLEAAQSHPLDPLWTDEAALTFIAEVLEAAFAAHGLPKQRQRSATTAFHGKIAEAAKEYLAAHVGERVTLDGVARAVNASPFHLARLFQGQTGLPLHRYLTRLRLRASLERLAEGERNLTALALDLGFASHSHFTDAFRREFGSAPSEIRRKASSRNLRQMSKNTEV